MILFREFFVFFLFELLAVSYLDIRERKIKNFWSVFHLILFVAFLFLYPESFQLSIDFLTYPIVALVVGFVLFALKIAGGGDAKFVATFFLLVPIHLRQDFLDYLLYSTLFVASITLLYNLIRNRSVFFTGIKLWDLRLIKSCFGSRFAFAPVILLAWFILLWKIKIF